VVAEGAKTHRRKNDSCQNGFKEILNLIRLGGVAEKVGTRYWRNGTGMNLAVTVIGYCNVELTDPTYDRGIGNALWGCSDRSLSMSGKITQYLWVAGL